MLWFQYQDRLRNHGFLYGSKGSTLGSFVGPFHTRDHEKNYDLGFLVVMVLIVQSHDHQKP